VVVLGRMLSVYGLVSIGNVFSVKIPLRWQHILVAGGIRGALSLALVLSLASNFPYREQLLTMTFGVVAMTIIFQGFAIKPLLGILGIGVVREDAYELARVQQISISAARTELDDLFRNHVISGPAYEKLSKELEKRFDLAKTQVDEIYGKDVNRIVPEMQMAKMKLIAAEKSSLEEAVHNGLITRQSAGKLIEAADQELDKLSNQDE